MLLLLLLMLMLMLSSLLCYWHLCPSVSFCPFQAVSEEEPEDDSLSYSNGFSSPRQIPDGEGDCRNSESLPGWHSAGAASSTPMGTISSCSIRAASSSTGSGSLCAAASLRAASSEAFIDAPDEASEEAPKTHQELEGDEGQDQQQQQQEQQEQEPEQQQRMRRIATQTVLPFGDRLLGEGPLLPPSAAATGSPPAAAAASAASAARSSTSPKQRISGTGKGGRSSSSSGGGASSTAAAAALELANLVSVDCERTQVGICVLHELWAAPLTLALNLFLVYRQIPGAFLYAVAVTGEAAIALQITATTAGIAAAVTGPQYQQHHQRRHQSLSLLLGRESICCCTAALLLLLLLLPQEELQQHQKTAYLPLDVVSFPQVSAC